jgi:hypothetical protein
MLHILTADHKQQHIELAEDLEKPLLLRAGTHGAISEPVMKVGLIY